MAGINSQSNAPKRAQKSTPPTHAASANMNFQTDETDWYHSVKTSSHVSLFLKVVAETNCSNSAFPRARDQSAPHARDT